MARKHALESGSQSSALYRLKMALAVEHCMLCLRTVQKIISYDAHLKWGSRLSLRRIPTGSYVGSLRDPTPMIVNRRLRRRWFQHTSHLFGLGNHVWLLLIKRDDLISALGEYWGYFMVKRHPLGLILNKLSGVAIGKLRRSSTMGFLLVSYHVCPSVRSVARRPRVNVLIYSRGCWCWIQGVPGTRVPCATCSFLRINVNACFFCALASGLFEPATCLSAEASISE